MIGTKLAHYEITRHLGTGGMGEVYQATDSKLGRSVAIKLLPEAFIHDADRAARFEREARVLASLNHPNIAAIYGIEQSGNRKFLVMELVPGETLAERIKRGPIPLNEALDIAKQIAEALEAAHDSEKAIIHRDLKPANVIITPEGKVKVLDFGLAKPFESLVANDALSNSPTLSMAATDAGVILGTAAYMSPEQAKGKTADVRSDIWALGVVLYEMLTGKAPFTGETTVEILSSMLKTDPDWSALPDSASPILLSLLRRCMQKDPIRRFRDVADVRIQIEEALTDPAIANVVPNPSGKDRARLLWIGATLAAMIAFASVSVSYLRISSVQQPEMRLQIMTAPGAATAIFAISPDGSKVAFTAPSEGRDNQLWVRPLNSETAQPLDGTDGETYPFWSPDSRSIGFYAGGQLKRIDLADGRVQTLTSAPNGTGGAWNTDGTILFSRLPTGPLFRIPSSGGIVEEVTRINAPQQAGHVFPQFLPDSRHFLFFSYGTRESQGAYVGSLDSPETKLLFENDTGAVFAVPNTILYARQGALLAQHLNLTTFQVEGEPQTVAREIAAETVNGQAALSASATGLIAYRSRDAERELVWFSRSGQQIASVSRADGVQNNMRLSPDARTVAVTRTVEENNDIWLVELERGIFRRFTLDPTNETGPVWSPDGSRIAFRSDPKGTFQIYERPVTGDGSATLLIESPQDKDVFDWSADGRYILYRDRGANTGNDLWAKPLFGDRKPIPIAQSIFSENLAKFSHDGRWVAYQSNETGQNEVYIQPFLRTGDKFQISTRGGAAPWWRQDGRELFYVGDNQVMAIPITLGDSTITTGTPTALFALQPGSFYVASADGQRFLVNLAKEASLPITILLNWKPAAN